MSIPKAFYLICKCVWAENECARSEIMNLKFRIELWYVFSILFVFNWANSVILQSVRQSRPGLFEMAGEYSESVEQLSCSCMRRSPADRDADEEDWTQALNANVCSV